MDNWKKEKVNELNSFLKDHDFIILRGSESWNLDSDIDVLCPTYRQKEDLKRYVYNGVKLDVFKKYVIKNIKIDYKTLLIYKNNENHELSKNIEALLFFIKDYIHLTKYRKHKHRFYKKPENIKSFLKEINCPIAMHSFLKPSSNIFSFFIRSFIVKLIYYTKA